MAIKSSTFGRVELSGKEAQLFVRELRDVKPNPKVIEAANRGRAMRQRMKNIHNSGK